MVVYHYATPIIASVVGFFLIVILAIVIWYKLRNFATYKEGQIVPSTDPTKINKFTKRATAHKFRQNSRYKATKKAHAQFSKLQAIYETKIEHSIDEIDVVDLEGLENQVLEFDSSLLQLHNKTLYEKHSDEHTSIHSSSFSDDGDRDRLNSRESINNSSKRNSFSNLSTLSVYTPRKSRGNSFIDIEDEKFEDIGTLMETHSERGFRYV